MPLPASPDIRARWPSAGTVALQGEDTDPKTVEKIATAIDNDEEVQVDIYNYRADGSGFWNRLMMSPLRDDEGETKFFVGIQHELDGDTKTSEPESDVDQILAEIQHRVKNHLSMVVSMIRVQARSQNAVDTYDSLARRVEALQFVYSEMSEQGAVPATSDDVPLGAYLGRIASAIAHIDGREGIRVNFDADKIAVPVETAARTGLVLSEVLTNSLQHAFEDRSEGLVEARVKQLSGSTLRISVMDDGTGMPDDHDWPQDGNLGSRIVRNLVAGLNGDLNVETKIKGTTITLDIPLDEQADIIASER